MGKESSKARPRYVEGMVYVEYLAMTRDWLLEVCKSFKGGYPVSLDDVKAELEMVKAEISQIENVRQAVSGELGETHGSQ